MRVFTNKRYHLLLACAREVPAVYIIRAAKEIWWYVFSAVYSSLFSYFFKFFLPSYIFQIYNKTLQSSELMPKRSHKYYLVQKKRECQNFGMCPRQNLHNFCYFMTVLVRAVLSPNLVFKV